MPAGPRRPDEDDHRAIEEPDGDEAITRRSPAGRPRRSGVAPASTSSARAMSEVAVGNPDLGLSHRQRYGASSTNVLRSKPCVFTTRAWVTIVRRRPGEAFGNSYCHVFPTSCVA